MSAGDAGRIAGALEDLPLAVNQAAAFLAETGCTVQEYLKLLTSRTAEVLAQGAPVTYPDSLAASWRPSRSPSLCLPLTPACCPNRWLPQPVTRWRLLG